MNTKDKFPFFTNTKRLQVGLRFEGGHVKMPYIFRQVVVARSGILQVRVRFEGRKKKNEGFSDPDLL